MASRTLLNFSKYCCRLKFVGLPSNDSQVFCVNLFPNYYNKSSHALFCRDYVSNNAYKQGQSPENNIREYFYFVDHQGMLFLDDARIKNFTSCFKEKKFLVFFFSRLRENNTGRYSEFRWYSPCGRERNFVRADDLPFVFTHIDGENIYYGHAGNDLRVSFQPEMVTMIPETGRVYHPAPDRAGGAGLIKSSLAIDLSTRFQFLNGEERPPTHFTWNGKKYDLVTWYDPSTEALTQR